jgi:phosphonate transport system ATP-binding protein
MSQIQLRNLTYKYNDTTVLNQIDFTINRGEFIAIIGPSGSGKSSFIECIGLEKKWHAGQYIYQNEEVHHLNKIQKYTLKKKWAYMKQGEGLESQRTAFQNVLEGRRNHVSLIRRILGKPGISEHVLVMDFLQKVGLMDLSERKVHQLSGGERRRVAIAKATIQEAELMLIDEPITGLDRFSSEVIMEDLQRLNQRNRTTIICVLSQIEYAEKYASRIIGLHEGQIKLDVSGRKLTQREREEMR